MRTRLGVALLGLALSLCALPSYAQAPAVPGLIIDSTTVVGRQLRVTVRNVGTLPITAFGVRGVVSYETGDPEKIGLSSEGAVSGFPFPEGPSATWRPFRPGAVYSFDCGVQLRDSVVTAVSLVPVAVIFADGASAGDGHLIRELFDNRARERRVLRSIVQIFSDVENSRPPLDASASIAEAQARLAAAGQEDAFRRSGNYNNVVLNLTLAGRLFAQDPARLAVRFTQMATDARRRHALAEQHYQPR
jgi:hypothetical protein